MGRAAGPSPEGSDLPMLSSQSSSPGQGPHAPVVPPSWKLCPHAICKGCTSGEQLKRYTRNKRASTDPGGSCPKRRWRQEQVGDSTSDVKTGTEKAQVRLIATRKRAPRGHPGTTRNVPRNSHEGG